MNPPPLLAFSRVREDGLVAIAAPVLGAAALLAVHFGLLHTYWEYSEGVYALTAHEILHGGDLYGHIVGAQPPGVFVAGVALLAIHDGLEWLRLGVACLQLGAGLIAARIVYRVSASAIAAALVPAAMLLTPWAVREHGALTPELVALPVMLGAALLSVDERRARWAGALCGLLVLIKFPLALPAVVVVAFAADRRRAALVAVVVVAAGLGAAWLVGGGGFWRDTVQAQLHTGSRGMGSLAGLWAQAGWNLAGLVVCAAAAVLLRAQARAPRLLTVTIALAAANLITVVSTVKEGTSLDILVPVEATLVPLAACGAVFAWRSTVRRSTAGPRAAVALCAAGLVFTLAQSVSLFASPQHPRPFLRAFSAPAWGATLTAPQFASAVRAARACPPGQPYGGPPLVALAAGRPVADDQPDQFLPSHSPTLAAVSARIAAAGPACPGPVSR
jgi:hypothetical protein